MSDIRIIQVEIGNMAKQELVGFCSRLYERLPSDVIIVPHKGDTGRLSAINVDDLYDISYKDVDDNIINIEVTGEELFESIKSLVESRRGDQ